MEGLKACATEATPTTLAAISRVTSTAFMAPNPDNPDRMDDARGAMSALDAARAVFDHTDVGMAVVSSTGTLLQTNPALQQLLGLDADALDGRS
ncbi:MAG: PAS domain-containing protein, partial [Myxococcota bacterium]|nr:PAS domain-containing protein [Myxococcota bacterium]